MNAVSDSLDNAVSGVWHDPHRKRHRGAHSGKDDRQDQYQQPKRQILDPFVPFENSGSKEPNTFKNLVKTRLRGIWRISMSRISFLSFFRAWTRASA